MLKLVDLFLKSSTHPSNFSSVPSAPSLTVVYTIFYKETQVSTHSITYEFILGKPTSTTSNIHQQRLELISFMLYWTSWMVWWNYILALPYAICHMPWGQHP